MASKAPLLSAALIVRDEEEHLGSCLESLRGVVDEVVVVDTGSTDDSVAVARAHGARVFRHEWAGDFSRARNIALDRVRGRWVLYIDADERLRPISREAVVGLLEDAEEVAFRVLLRPFVGATPGREFRLWRNDARIRFDGIIHEKVVPAIRAVAEADGRCVGTCNVALDHLGYEHDQMRKHVRNLPLLRAQLAVEPRNVFNWRHLAAVLAALGEVEEAEGALERAVDLVRAGDAPSGGALAYADLIRFRPDGVARERLIDEGLASYPYDPLLLWTKAVMDLDAGNPRAALLQLDRLAEVDPSTLDDTISYDERLFDVLVHRGRGLALFRLGRYEEAADAYANAERCEPGNPEHRVRRRMAAHLSTRGRPVSSRRVLDIAGVAIAFRATDRERGDAVDAVVGSLPRHGGRPRLEVTFGAEPIARPQERHDHADGDVRAWWRGDDLYLAHGSFVAQVGRTSARISGDGAPARAFRQLFPYIVTHLLAPLDVFVLHGGAVQRGGRAVLVLGGTGSGKSTIVAGALHAGWTALADDLVVVRLGHDGPEVCGVAKPLAVPFDVVEHLHVPARAIDADPRRRWRVTVDASRRTWLPVVSTIVSAHAATPRGRFEELTSAELFEWILYSFLARHERARLRRFLGVAAALTCEGAWTLHHGSDASIRIAQVEELLDRVAASHEPVVGAAASGPDAQYDPRIRGTGQQ